MVRKQKTDPRDALHILDLLLANRFPRDPLHELPRFWEGRRHPEGFELQALGQAATETETLEVCLEISLGEHLQNRRETALHKGQ